MRWLPLLLIAAPAGATSFRNPVVGSALVSAYEDDGGGRDWTCGDHTYGGHGGTDIAIIGTWAAMDEGREVVAGASGTVVQTHDGEFDRCTTGDCGGGGGFGNYVAIQHDDGKVSYYGHMRRGSVAVAQGQHVDCGQHLGLVGSSGHSTGPHCHFEVRVGGASDDPFAGQCGGPQSYWVNQGDYLGLPASDCEGGGPPPPPAHPDMQLGAALEMPARACDFDDCADFVRDGQSGGTADAWVGETFAVRFTVTDAGDGPTDAESEGDAAVLMDYEAPASLQVVRYLVESDWPAKDRASWQRNDAMDNPANPREDQPGARGGSLRLNGFSPGETKRLTLWVRAAARSIDGGGHAEIRGWIHHLRDFYGEKTGWDDPVEVNDGQSYNGGDLRVASAADVFDPTAFLFDSPDEGQTEGWHACEGAGPLHLADGALAAGASRCVESPRLDVPLDGWPGVRLAVRGAGWLYWTTEGMADFDDAHRVPFAAQEDEVAPGPGWSGTLTRLRLVDPGDVGEVRLTADAPPPPDAAVVDAAPAVDAAAFDAGSDAGTYGERASASRLDGGCATAPLGGGAPWLLLIASAARRRRRARPGAGR